MLPFDARAFAINGQYVCSLLPLNPILVSRSTALNPRTLAAATTAPTLQMTLRQRSGLSGPTRSSQKRMPSTSKARALSSWPSGALPSRTFCTREARRCVHTVAYPPKVNRVCLTHEKVMRM
jgi:hypothetical protein